MTRQFQLVTRSIALILLLCGVAFQPANADEHRFSVKDDIELAQFGDVYFWVRGDIVVSPEGDKVLVHTMRASLKDNAIHDELRVYTITQLREFVNRTEPEKVVDPIWTLEESRPDVGGDGPLVSDLRWLDDESGVAFLLQTDPQHRRLCVADLDSGVAKELTSDQDDVLGFAIRDKSHYVFTVSSHETKDRLLRDLDAPFQVGTDRPFWDLLFPEQELNFIGRGDLWAARGGAAAPVLDPSTDKPVVLYEAGSQNLSLSPDGNSLVSVQAVGSIPKTWETLYPPPFPQDAYRIRSGSQDLNAAIGFALVGEYVLIELKSGKVTPLIHAPTAAGAGWFEEGPARPDWSDDGNNVLLPGAFLSDQSGRDEKPCVVAIQIETGVSECVRPLKRDLASGFEPGYARTDEVRFVRGRSEQVLLRYFNRDQSPGVQEYDRTANGTWKPAVHAADTSGANALDVRVVATFKDPPLLVATDLRTGKSRTVFDPNPQLKNLALGEPELYHWVDRTGREWQGILYKPVGYSPGVKYPLVIQNHGFSEDRFTPSGGFPSAFAAEELASAGIMVLQVRDCAGRATPNEGPCNVEGYEAAVEKLSQDGLADSSRIGIIGFSRTVYYVLEALTTSNLRFKAASITDGINVGYLDYMFAAGPNQTYRREMEAMMGARPIGPGLQTWIKNAPLFNMDKVTAPLRVVATRSGSLVEMWEPYALLEEMGKPVDLIVLNTDEHVITNPRVRQAAQGGNVDWFRFWLQGYEDPDPAKKEQYLRWRKFREMQTTH